MIYKFAHALHNLYACKYKENEFDIFMLNIVFLRFNMMYKKQNQENILRN